MPRSTEQSVSHDRIVTIPLYFDFRPRKAAWTVLDRDGGPLLKCAEREPLAIGHSKRNAWEMRDEFFHLRRGDVPALLDFLNKWGPWAEHYGEPEITRVWFANPRDTREVSARAIWDTQERYRLSLKNPFEWFGQGVNVLKPTEAAPASYPYWGMTATSCEYAMRISITIDLLNQVPFGICKRKDCGAPFAVTSKHPKTYCSQYCGHLESMRRQRRNACRAKGGHRAKD